MPNAYHDHNALQDAAEAINYTHHLRLAGDKVAGARDACAQILALELQLDDLLKSCRHIVKAEKNIEALKASPIGAALPPDEWFQRAYLEQSPEEAKTPVEEFVRRSIRAHCLSRLEPIAREIARHAINEFQVDLDQIEKFESPLARKYSLGVSTGGLAKALRAAITLLQRDVALPLQIHGGELRSVVKGWFSTPLERPIFKISPAASLPAAPTPPIPPASTPYEAPAALRTAAAVALSRSAA